MIANNRTTKTPKVIPVSPPVARNNWAKKILANRGLLLLVILGIHCVLILLPAMYYLLPEEEEDKENKEIVLRVDIAGLEPSSAPIVGEPERIAPGGAPEPPPTPEPPAPEPPKIEPKKKSEPKKKGEPKKKVEPKKKGEPKKKVEPKKKSEPKKVENKQKKTNQKKTNQNNKNTVYTDPNAAKFDPNKKYTGGTNQNKNVTIGKRDAGQKQGPANNKTPADGKSAVSEKEWEEFSNELSNIIFDKWIVPPGVLITESTAAVISIRVDKNGMVIGKKLLKTSPNRAVNDSVRGLLKNLNKINAPPGNSATGWLDITLIPESR